MRPARVTALTTLAASSLTALAQMTGGPYVVSPSVIAGGGATLSGGRFQLSGTLGQPATAEIAAAGYRVYDGFWGPRAPLSDDIFRDGFDP